MFANMKHIHPTLTAEQKRNLITLAQGLLHDGLRPGVRFDMAKFAKSAYRGGRGVSDMTDCGTAGCAIGHGPFYGITKSRDEDWFAYSQRCFIASGDNNSDMWNWCFGGNWALVDNTKRGAARRIIYMLQYGVPDNLLELPSLERQLLYDNIDGFCESYVENNKEFFNGG